MIPVAGGELYETWSWTCKARDCKTRYTYRNEHTIKKLAREHQVEAHPEHTGQTSLLDELQGLDQH